MMIDSAGSSGPVIQLTMDFRAPKPKVWQCWTDPALLKKWFFADEGWRTTVAEIDLRPLGPWRLGMTSTGERETIFQGYFHDIRPNDRLTYTWTTANSDMYWTLVTARFMDHGAGSRVELVHGVFENEEHRALHEQGWVGCVTQLGKLVDV